MPEPDPFAGLHARGPVAALVDGRGWWQAMLDVEAAPAGACARGGEIPEEAADAIAAACRLELYDLEALGREAALSASPVVPLAAALRERSNEHAPPRRDEPGRPRHRHEPGGASRSLGSMAGSVAKVASDVVLMAQGEVGEAREGGGGGRSSAMAHKRNPAAAVSVLACAARVPGAVATVLAGMPQEHERGAGSWQAEWGAITDALRLTGSAVAWTRELLEHLEVDPERMRENLVGDVDLGASQVLIDRALTVHRTAPR